MQHYSDPSVLQAIDSVAGTFEFLVELHDQKFEASIIEKASASLHTLIQITGREGKRGGGLAKEALFSEESLNYLIPVLKGNHPKQVQKRTLKCMQVALTQTPAVKLTKGRRQALVTLLENNYLVSDDRTVVAAARDIQKLLQYQSARY